jgi:2-polyprenyl-3-methyl-5-hydroxy-6-metoxy-1,4-benzoquinol methylase
MTRPAGHGSSQFHDDPEVAVEGASHRFAIQSDEYDFPYHWIPEDRAGRWTVSRVATNGFEYLGLLVAVRDLVLGRSPQRVLEIGCGDGHLAGQLATGEVPEIVGVDLVEQAIGYAKAFNARHSPRTRFYTTAVQELGEADFDVAVAMEVLEHIPEGVLPEVVVAIWERVRPGGWFVVSVPTDNMPVSAKHERHYTVELLATHLAPHFDVVETHYQHRITRQQVWLSRALANRFVAVRHPAALRAAASYYRRRLQPARSHDGVQLIVVARRNDDAARG